MRTSRWIWAIWALVAIAFIVPYGLLRHVHAWYGSFLLWALVGVAVIAVNAVATRGFAREDEFYE